MFVIDMALDSKFLIITVFILQLIFFAAGIGRKHVSFIFIEASTSIINVDIMFFLGFPRFSR